MQKGSPRAPERWQDPTRRGNCLCYPSREESKVMLQELGLEGIEYVDGVPQFGPVKLATVGIDRMTQERQNWGKPARRPKFDPNAENPFESYLGDLYLAYDDVGGVGNFEQADIRLAKKWTQENRDGHSWTPADVEKYREQHNLTWHECSDRETMELVPSCIHDDFKHYGGVASRKEVDKEHTAWEAQTGEIDDAHRTDYENPEDPTDSTPPAPPTAPGGYSLIHLVITFGLTIGYAITYFLCGSGNLLDTLFWIIAVAGPYGVLLILCAKLGGLPKLLHNKTGGLIILILFVVLIILIPMLVSLLFYVYIALGILAFIKGADVFGPNGVLTVQRTDEHGRTTTETRAVYGDMDSAVSQAEQELKDEGYTDIRRD